MILAILQPTYFCLVMSCLVNISIHVAYIYVIEPFFLGAILAQTSFVRTESVVVVGWQVVLPHTAMDLNSFEAALALIAWRSQRDVKDLKRAVILAGGGAFGMSRWLRLTPSLVIKWPLAQRFWPKRTRDTSHFFLSSFSQRCHVVAFGCPGDG